MLFNRLHINCELTAKCEEALSLVFFIIQLCISKNTQQWFDSQNNNHAIRQQGQYCCSGNKVAFPVIILTVPVTWNIIKFQNKINTNSKTLIMWNGYDGKVSSWCFLMAHSTENWLLWLLWHESCVYIGKAFEHALIDVLDKIAVDRCQACRFFRKLGIKIVVRSFWFLRQKKIEFVLKKQCQSEDRIYHILKIKKNRKHYFKYNDEDCNKIILYLVPFKIITWYWFLRKINSWYSNIPYSY